MLTDPDFVTVVYSLVSVLPERKTPKQNASYVKKNIYCLVCLKLIKLLNINEPWQKHIKVVNAISVFSKPGEVWKSQKLSPAKASYSNF